MRKHITVTHGLRGYFACMVDDEGPIASGFGSYGTADVAADEAKDWAKSEGLPFVPFADGPRYSNDHPTNAPAVAAHTRGLIEDLLKDAPAELAARVRAWVATVGDDVAKLDAGMRRLAERLREEKQP